ncbi:MAG: helix-turn-helix domain-containing protein [Acidobacteriota bacterium]|nr:helix-turn-helix domain-containing protein [Acidobacteriota bacterium]
MRRASAIRSVGATTATPAADASTTGVAVVSRRESAAALVHPVRRRVLEALKAPGSATMVAATLKLSRQVVNYHVRALERAGLVEEVERRQRRGLEERIVRATAAYYLIAPDALSGNAAPASEGRDITDRFSASYQVAMAARTIREVAALGELATRAGKRLSTMSLDSEVTFATPAAREAFARDLLDAVTDVVARHHRPATKGAHTYRVFAGAHPKHFGDSK